MSSAPAQEAEDWEEDEDEGEKSILFNRTFLSAAFAVIALLGLVFLCFAGKTQ
jgi:hypothetical protein